MTIKNPLDDMVKSLMKKAAPLSEKVFTDILKEIETEAKASWPVRQPVKPVRDKEGNIKTVQKGPNAGKPRLIKQTSKRSIDKYRLGTRFESGKVVVFLENTAPYAFAIRMGIDTRGDRGKDIFLPLGKRVAQELLISPLRKNTKRAVDALLEDMMRTQKKGG
jgi:hypothetical protein